MLDKKIIADYLHNLANQIGLGEAIVSQFKTEGYGYQNLEMEWHMKENEDVKT